MQFDFIAKKVIPYLNMQDLGCLNKIPFEEFI
jgi:hypothetical protein